MDRAPRSMIRARLPDCLPAWKSSDRSRVWAKLSTAERAMAAWDTGWKIMSRSRGAAAETIRRATAISITPMKAAESPAARCAAEG